MASAKKFNWLKWLIILLLLGGGGAGGWWYYKRAGKKPIEYRTAKIGRGDITQAVTANGQLTAVKNVQVGSQISGIITEINADFNSKVKKDEVVAKIDPSTYERNLAQVDAELSNAKAGLELAEFNYKQAKALIPNKLISESEYNRNEVELHQAQAVVKMRQANVERAKVDLERTIITAPIDGIVILRNIEVGQTVAASFNTPTLFMIANDLAKMQIEAAVSEADVGGVEEAQPVNFTVEAFTRQFRGQVRQVRYAPITNQNVVTYTAIVDVDNSDLKLRPGMTATASIIISQRKDVLRVPNAAFRFRPPEGAIVQTPTNALSRSGGSPGKSAGAPATEIATSGPFAGLPVQPWAREGRRPTQEEREKYEASLTAEQKEKYRQIRDEMRARFAQAGGSGGGFGGAGGFGGGGVAKPARQIQEGPRSQTVYVLETGTNSIGEEKSALRAVTVKTGISDGTSTEVLEGLNEGDIIVTAVVSPESVSPASQQPGGRGSNPFTGQRRFF